MTDQLNHAAWIIVSPDGPPLLYSLRGSENEAWMAATRGTGRIWPPLHADGYRAALVMIKEVGGNG